MAPQKLRTLIFAITAFSLGMYVGVSWRQNYHSPMTVVKSEQSSVRNVQNDVLASRNKVQYDKVTGSCMPQDNVMFLKTHKTASTAVQNILLRYADQNNLTVGLSKTYDIRFHYGMKFQHNFVAKSQKPINILCHHMVFNKAEVQKVMPPTSKYITILREPTALFESMFDYFHYDSTPFSRVKRNQLEYWLDHTNLYFKGRKDGAFTWFAKNGVFFDMGYDNLSDDDFYIQQAITELEEAFDLVMLADYFSESMILLKDLLCWSMEDILSLKTNARTATATELNDVVKKKIRAWNKADAAVYDHFNQTFWKKVEEYGFDRMRKDIKLLDEMNVKLRDRCIEGDAVTNDKIKDKINKVYNPKGVKMKGYNIKNSAKNDKVCVNLIKGEIQWTREMMAVARSNSSVS